MHPELFFNFWIYFTKIKVNREIEIKGLALVQGRYQALTVPFWLLLCSVSFSFHSLVQYNTTHPATIGRQKLFKKKEGLFLRHVNFFSLTNLNMAH